MIYLLRHSERKDQSSDEKEKLSWKKSKRFNQNPFDIPLSKNGFNVCYNAIEAILKNFKGDFGFIYSSPLTRCI